MKIDGLWCNKAAVTRTLKNKDSNPIHEIHIRVLSAVMSHLQM